MGKTSIEWTDASWNPVVGCSEVSPGCAHCYAARLAGTRLRNLPDYAGLTILGKSEDGIVYQNCQPARIHWSRNVRFLPERLAEPASWRKPRRIFVCDMGDLFHENVQQSWLVQIFRAMAAAPQHTYQILTKRAQRMKEWLYSFALVERHHQMRDDCPWPWPNVWCGVSVENQHFANERIPHLLATPAAVRFISAEPLLGPVDLSGVDLGYNSIGPYLDWVICGGESGAGARPMDPAWPRLLRDQCDGRMPFFFKQWGEYLPPGQYNVDPNGERRENFSKAFWRVGKKNAGRQLDGREWSEFPR